MNPGRRALRTASSAAGALAAMLPPHETGETTVLVAVSSACVREALVAMIGALDGFRVVAETGIDEHAILLARARRPTLAVIDQDLPSAGGLWAIELLARERLASAIVALGSRGDEATRQRAYQAGAHAYVQSGVPPRDILGAVEAALQGGLVRLQRGVFSLAESSRA